MDLKLEVVPIPVSDVDAAKAFYTGQVDFNLDHDASPTPGMRVVQMTPPGSACSIAFGRGLVEGEPGSVKGLQAVVADIEEAHRELSGRGVPVTAVEDLAWGRFLWFDDPDGNHWALQQL
ncbi:MAG: VOC family protein, partial [Actinomycetota bacterium]